jgi:hypothetical protein
MGWALGVFFIITTFTILDILPRRDVSAQFGAIGIGMGSMAVILMVRP